MDCEEQSVFDAVQVKPHRYGFTMGHFSQQRGPTSGYQTIASTSVFKLTSVVSSWTASVTKAKLVFGVVAASKGLPEASSDRATFTPAGWSDTMSPVRTRRIAEETVDKGFKC